MRDSRPTVYLDTNILSVLHYRGGDPRVLYQQLETRTWWKTERKLYQMFSSIITERELVRGSFPGQDAAIAEVKRLHYLRPTADVERCVKAYIEARLIPDTKVADAQQLAFATVYVIDYLLTWNCSHLANVETQRRLAILNKRMKLRSPLLVSPDTIPKAALGQPIRRHDEDEG